MGKNQVFHAFSSLLTDHAAAGQALPFAAGGSACLAQAQCPHHIDERVMTGHRLEAAYIRANRKHRLIAVFRQAGHVAATKPMLQLRGQRIVKLVAQWRSPALGVQNRQATVALTNHQGRLVDLHRHDHREHFKLKRRGPGCAVAGRAHRCDQRVIVGLRRGAGAHAQCSGEYHQFQAQGHCFGSGSMARDEDGALNERGAASPVRPRISDSGWRLRKSVSTRTERAVRCTSSSAWPNC